MRLSTNCHMYENELPEEGDLVMVKILSVNEGGAQCKLLEYGDIEGLLPSTEYSRKRIRSIKKLVRPGKKDVLTVIRVNQEKHYIDLSKKHVTKSEFEEVSTRFRKSNFVHSCMKQICYKQQATLREMYQQIAWPLYHDFGHAFDGLEKASQDLSILDKYHLDIPIRDELKRSLERKFQQISKVVTCTVEVSCIGVSGINAIKDSLIEAKKLCNPFVEKTEPNTNHVESLEHLEINIIKCPTYSISVKGMDVESMKERVEKAATIVQHKIESYEGGMFSKKELNVQ